MQWIYSQCRLAVCVCCTLLGISPLLAQKPPQILWQRCVGGNAFDNATCVDVLPDSSYLIAGTTFSYDVPRLHKSTGDADVLLIKCSPVGEITWLANYGGKFTEEAFDVRQLPDGGFVVCGLTDSPEYSGGENDLYVLRVDALGRQRWARGYGGQGNERGNALVLAPDGGFLVVGETGSNTRDVSRNHGGLDGWVVKLDAQGKLLWEKSIGGTGNDKLKTVLLTRDGHYLMAGPSDSNNGDLPGNYGKTDVMVVKMTLKGEIVWVKHLGGNSFDDAFGLIELPDGDLIMVGTTYSSAGQLKRTYGENDVFLARLDKDANLKWEKTYGGAEDDGGNSACLTPAGQLLIAGTSRSKDGLIQEGYGRYDAWLLLTDLEGNVVWSQNYGGSKDEQFYRAVPLQNGSIFALGFSFSEDFDLTYTPQNGGNDAWLVHLGWKPTPKETVPTTLVGYVKDATTGAIIPAEVSLIRNSTAQVLAKAQSDTTVGTYWMMFRDSTDLSLGVLVPGYFFYSEDLVIPPHQRHGEVRFDIELRPIVAGGVQNMRHIQFATGKSIIQSESYPELDRLVRFMEMNPTTVIQINGHTDDTGDPEGKLTLSAHRAAAVRRYLESKGIDKERLRAKGFGMDQPLVPNTSEKNRQKNRRVEFEVIRK
ncbi:MAG: OmpA family protein [Bacteroidetes bacterium]|nr:OmpA family protein [Bacteroidota bacterium]